MVNGLGTVVAACFGSPFPTTIYIGHPGWKAMGARAGYSLLDAIVIVPLCLMGGVAAILKVVPLEVTLPILLWIGIIITAQAFQAVPARHALAVAIGLIPPIAAWSRQVLIQNALPLGSYQEAAERLPQQGVYLDGILALEHGFLILSMTFASLMVFIIDRRFLAAAGICGLSAVLSMLGLIHAYELTPMGPEYSFGFAAAPGFALAYAISGGILLLMHAFGKHKAEPPDSPSAS